MLTLFLAKRFYKPHAPSEDQGKRRGAASSAIGIATAGVAVGLAVMLITICVVKGFQSEVQNTITGFASHIEVMDPRSYATPEAYPLVTSKQIVDEVKQAPGVVHVQRMSEKMGIFKTENDFTGMCLKGVASSDYDLSFLRAHIVEGQMPEFRDDTASNRIVISRLMAEKMGLKVGSKVYTYFFERTIKQRLFHVAAIYDTHMHQFDDTFVITDLYTVNRLNSWMTDQSSGLEVRLSSMDDIPAAHLWLNKHLGQKRDRNGNTYAATNIYENFRTASVLSWLRLLDFNIVVILVIMMCVSGFTMVSGLLILILERTSTIGILKALGATNTTMRHTFLWYASLIVVRGMVWGNVIGLGLAALQHYTGLFHLDPASYYVDAVPVEFNWLWIIGVNIVTLVITMLALIVPSFLVSTVQPAKAIQFD